MKREIAPFSLSALAVASGASRLFFVRDTPINWDAVQFALAIGHFDLHEHQPHPPGYILYVLAGRAVNLAANNPGMALGLLSVLCSAVVVPLVYWLGLCVFEDRGVALCAAVLALGSPLVFYYGSVGLTYLPEMLLGVWVAGLAWTVKSRVAAEHRLADVRQVIWLGVALGIAGGVRQTTLPVLLPLCLWALWDRARRDRVLFAGTLAATCSLWLAPLLVMSGGIDVYLRESLLLAQTASVGTSIMSAGFEGLAYDVGFEAIGLAVGLAFAAIPLGLWATRTLRFSITPGLKAFLLWWIAPLLLLYAVSHVGQYGYMLVVLPPLFLMSAVCLRVLLGGQVGGRKPRAASEAGSYTQRPGWGARWAVAAATGLSLLSAGYFLFAEGPTTLSSISRNDTHWNEVRSTLGKLDRSHTVLIMSIEWAGPFRMAGYLLPDYHSYAAEEDPSHTRGWLYSAYGGRSTYALPHPASQPYLQLPSGTTAVVALDDTTGAMIAAQKGVRPVSLRDGSTLYILESTATGIQGLTMSGDTIRVKYLDKP